VPTALQPMTLGELLDRTFQLYRRHFLIFVGIVALPQLVLLVLQLARPDMGPATSDIGQALARLGHMMLWGLLILIVAVVVGSAAQGATVVAVSDVHLGRPTGIGRAYSVIMPRLAVLCLIGVLFGLAVFFGLLLFVIPGVLLALAWSLVVPVAVIEETGIGEAIARSRFLTRGFRGQIFVTFVLYVVLTLVASAIWEIPIFVASFAAVRAGTPGQLPAWATVLAPVGSSLTQSVVGPLLTIAMSLFYYDLRVRKEGFDLEHMMAELDHRPAPAPAAGV
jgi:hypothetical protein